jgi:tetratricopeptide (TPR) repeat protein
MLTLFKIQFEKDPVRLSILAILLLAAFPSFSQLKDSADLYYQKGLSEKQNARRLESLKQFEKANKYDSNNKAILNEMAIAYMDLHKYDRAITTYKNCWAGRCNRGQL